MYLAMARASLNWAKHETVAAQTMTTAPFGAKAHFGRSSEAAHQFFTNFDIAADVFTYYHPSVASQLRNGKLPVEFGPAGRTQLIWETCGSSWIFASSGATVKTGRRYVPNL